MKGPFWGGYLYEMEEMIFYGCYFMSLSLNRSGPLYEMVFYDRSLMWWSLKRGPFFEMVLNEVPPFEVVIHERLLLIKMVFWTGR